jgi:flagellar hook-associated protein FlgK
MEVISTNLANASTEGYHRQDVRIVTLPTHSMNNVALGGSKLQESRRAVDVLLETELLRQQPQMGQAWQELMALRSLETGLGESPEEGLSLAITDFFSALKELAAQPDNQALQEQVIWAADTVARHFRNTGQVMLDLQQHLRLEGEDLISQVNELTAEIAQLNDEIHAIVTRNGNPNLLVDRRDQAISELGELVDVQVDKLTDGSQISNVIVWGTPVVVRGSNMELEVGLNADMELGVSVKDAAHYQTNVSGGRIGGLLALNNETLKDISDKLDTLASEMVYQLNRHHVQGVGTSGTFTERTGWAVSSTQLSEWSQWGEHLQAGSFRVRVHDATAGTTTVHGIDVLATDTAADIAAKLDAVAGLTGGVVDQAIRVSVEDTARYSFDFLPAAELTLGAPWTGSAAPSVEGVYQGPADETYTFTVLGGGTVGLTDGLALEVRNTAGEVVTTVNVGGGYAAGDPLDLPEGLSLSLAAGDLVAGEQFTVEALTQSDTSGLLAVAGINAFMRGDSALTMYAEEELMGAPGRLAVSLGPEGSDNLNVLRMGRIGEDPNEALDGLSPPDAYRMIVASVGQRIAFSQARMDSLENMNQQLLNQRDLTSGVDINQQASQLLLFERMYQALAKLLQSQQRALGSLMDAF